LDNDTFLAVESLSFGYTADRLILKNINMRFRRGSVVALMGGSGCGKTTVLRAIGAQVRPSRGRVMLEGVDVHGLDRAGLAAARRRMGMLFQHGALFTDLNIYENVAFPLREHTDLPPDRIRARVAEILSWIDLEGIEDKLPSELSGGMQKRVGLARTIALEPEIVIYDEPTTGLDPLTSDTISELIRRLQKERRLTSIVVTHDIRCTFHVADRVAMIDEGRILVKGTLDEVRGSEVPKVRAFLYG